MAPYRRGEGVNRNRVVIGGDQVSLFLKFNGLSARVV
jgi:hypothetical protein